MLLRALSFIFAAGLLAVAPGVAAAQTAHQHDGACCKTAAACCSAPQATCCTEREPIAPQPIVNRPDPTGRQTMTVWFHRPVKIGDRILLGQYVIEHDTVRMARNRPCTYIYAASDQRLPVVAFHCTHLKRARRGRGRRSWRPHRTLTTRSTGVGLVVSCPCDDGGWHGVAERVSVPAGREHE
jgi:hypothetical protein